VDVEDLARPPLDRKVVRRFCSPEEILDVETAGSRWHDRFLEHWTLKEAYLKARGVGISVRLSDLTFVELDSRPRVTFCGSLAGTDARWAFHFGHPTDRHVLAVAASAADGIVPRFVTERLDAAALAGLAAPRT